MTHHAQTEEFFDELDTLYTQSDTDFSPKEVYAGNDASQFIARRFNLDGTRGTGNSPVRQIRFPKELDQKLSEYVREHNMTVSEFIRDIVQEKLAS